MTLCFMQANIYQDRFAFARNTLYWHEKCFGPYASLNQKLKYSENLFLWKRRDKQYVGEMINKKIESIMLKNVCRNKNML